MITGGDWRKQEIKKSTGRTSGLLWCKNILSNMIGATKMMLRKKFKLSYIKEKSIGVINRQYACVCVYVRDDHKYECIVYGCRCV